MAEVIQTHSVGIAFAHGDMSPERKNIEGAMRFALELAQAKGISDPDELRSLMLAARDRALNA